MLDSEGRYSATGGGVLLVPAGLAHGIENMGSEGLVFVSVSA